MVPVVNFASGISWPLIILGFIFHSSMGLFFLKIGIILFSVSVLFQLVTLPVEFDASHRALKILESTHILGDEELKHSRKVLGAAALTYVAGAAAAILSLLRLIILTGGSNDD